MSEFRQDLLNRMIRLYGHENELVINFAKACENPNVWDYVLEYVVKDHEGGIQ